MDTIKSYLLSYFFFRKKNEKEREKREISFRTKKECQGSMVALNKNPYARILSCHRVIETRRSLSL